MFVCLFVCSLKGLCITDIGNSFSVILKCAIAVVCRKTNGEVNISQENTTVVVWIYDGV